MIRGYAPYLLSQIKSKVAYFCNTNCLTSPVDSGFIRTGYLLFGRNYLMTFILASAFYFMLGIFYRIQSETFCGFLVPLPLCRFYHPFCQFLRNFLSRLTCTALVAVFSISLFLSFCSFILRFHASSFT